MKNPVLIFLVIFIASASVSCNKGVVNPQAVVGNWRVVSDSTYINFGVGSFDTAYYHVYRGVAADHFDFTAEGKLYVKEGDFLADTANYTVTGQKLNLVYTYFYEGGVTIKGNVANYTISNLTNYNLILVSDALTPEGPVDETITLKRE